MDQPATLTDHLSISVPRAALEALIAVWDAWNECDVYDPDGQPGIWALVGVEGGSRLDEAHGAAERHVETIKQKLSDTTPSVSEE